MALINLNRKCLYLFEPHTASRATKRALFASSGWSEVGHHHINTKELVDWRRQHIAPHQLHGFKIFVTVRHPFDVLITRWKFGPNRKMPFHEFVRKFAKQPNITRPLKGLWQEGTHFLYYEDLKEDLKWVFGKNVVLERKDNETTPNKASWYTYYQHHHGALGVVHNAYFPFMDRFGYGVDMIGGQVVGTLSKQKRRELTKPWDE